MSGDLKFGPMSTDQRNLYKQMCLDIFFKLEPILLEGIPILQYIGTFGATSFDKMIIG